MRLQRHSLRFVAIAVVISLPLLGASGAASAKAKPSGCHKTHTCKSGGGTATGGGTGGSPAPMTVQIDPNPLVETGGSFIVATVQVLVMNPENTAYPRPGRAPRAAGRARVSR